MTFLWLLFWILCWVIHLSPFYGVLISGDFSCSFVWKIFPDFFIFLDSLCLFLSIKQPPLLVFTDWLHIEDETCQSACIEHLDACQNFVLVRTDIFILSGYQNIRMCQVPSVTHRCSKCSYFHSGLWRTIVWPINSQMQINWKLHVQSAAGKVWLLEIQPSPYRRNWELGVIPYSLCTYQGEQLPGLFLFSYETSSSFSVSPPSTPSMRWYKS